MTRADQRRREPEQRGEKMKMIIRVRDREKREVVCRVMEISDERD